VSGPGAAAVSSAAGGHRHAANARPTAATRRAAKEFGTTRRFARCGDGATAADSATATAA
jgi:hypothetical protein